MLHLSLSSILSPSSSLQTLTSLQDYYCSTVLLLFVALKKHFKTLNLTLHSFACLALDLYSAECHTFALSYSHSAVFDRCCWKLPLPSCLALLQCLQDSNGDRYYGYIQHQQGGLREVVPGTVHFLSV